MRFDFLYNFCPKKNFPISRRTERDIIINVRRSSCKVTVFLVKNLTKLVFPRQIFEKKTPNIKFHENENI